MDIAITAVTEADHDELYARFAEVVAAGEGYPQDPHAPFSRTDFDDYWLQPARVGAVARDASTGALVGGYTMRPNGPGRAAHVANAGYFVVAAHRGQGIGESLVHHSMDAARAAGFDAMQFNLVFETNPARRLYERLGFEVVGRVPEVIDGEAVLLYWRRL